MCLLWSEFGTEVPPTGFVAEDGSVLNNPTAQLTSNIWRLISLVYSALKCLLRGVAEGDSVQNNPAVQLTSNIWRLISLYFSWRLTAESWQLQTQKSPTLSNRAFSNLEPGDVLLSHGKCHTIIGAVSFHYWVRHGVRWVQNAIVTKQIWF